MTGKIKQADFKAAIEKYVQSDGVSYIDALMHFAEEHGLEVETVAKMLNRAPHLKEKVESECGTLRLLRQ